MLLNANLIQKYRKENPRRVHQPLQETKIKQTTKWKGEECAMHVPKEKT